MITTGSVSISIDRAAIEGLAGSGELRDGMEIIGQVGELSAKEHCPVDTGNLRRSITHEVVSDGRGVLVRIGTNVDYAIYQELGTRNHPAHPFLRPALESIRRFVG